MSKQTAAVAEAPAKAPKSGFRSNVDIENFYRFVHENGLRNEAVQLLEFVQSKLVKPKKRGRRKKIQ
ncbi:MAG: hypothetical protein KC493_00545 [Bacteriovoracaceae bacterium]|nr:hypothetical protein [Bacteriovoracaceae bacterium]